MMLGLIVLSTAVLAGTEEIGVRELRELATVAVGEDAKSLWARMSPELQRAIDSQDNLAALGRQIQTQFGAEIDVLAEEVDDSGDNLRYRRISAYSQGKVPLVTEIVLSRGGTIEGLAITPYEPPLTPPEGACVEEGKLPANEWIETLLNSAIAVGTLPSIIVGIHDANGLRFIAAGDAGDGHAPDSDTVFEVGSITKGLTGLLLAEMVANGDVTADQPIRTLYPPHIPLTEVAGAITLEELATHRSGLPRVGTGKEMQQRLYSDNPYAGSSATEVFRDVALVADEDIQRGRGHYAYSNLGIALLGQLLARAANTEYELLLEQRVSKALDLPRFALKTGNEGRHAQGTRLGEPATTWTLDGYTPAGGWRASARQLVSLGQQLLADRPAWVRRALGPHYRSGSEGVGYGWLHGYVGARALVWHDGKTGGFSSYLAVLPDEGIVIVMLSNGLGNLNEVAETVLRTGCE